MINSNSWCARCTPINAIKTFFFVAILFSCSDGYNQSDIDRLYKNSAYLRETAAFISGLALPKDSSLKPLTETEQYKNYKTSIEGYWGKYREVNLQPIESWQKTQVPKGISKKLFYPFSGPDLLNALAFFPDSEEIIMIGLEPAGEVPDPKIIDKNLIGAELNTVKTALRTLLQLNFFRTDEMRVDMRQKSFSSIPGIMMFFLTRFGFEILDFKKVYIGGDGNLAPFTEDKKDVTRGIEIVFRKPGSKILRTARFFTIDLSDGNLKKSGNVINYFNKFQNFNTFIKSASYLLHYNNFSVLRSYILTGSTLVLQEDSGIPYKYFSSAEWDIKYYGNYRVIDLFKERYQPDFAEAMKKNSLGTLPFFYGYGFSKERSNVIISKRKY